MNFIKDFVAFTKGENPEELAKHIQKRATTAMKSQLSSLENDILSKEDEIETIDREYKEALYNGGEKEFSSSSYVKVVFESLFRLDKAKSELEDLNKKKSIIKTILEDLK